MELKENALSFFTTHALDGASLPTGKGVLSVSDKIIHSDSIVYSKEYLFKNRAVARIEEPSYFPEVPGHISLNRFIVLLPENSVRVIVAGNGEVPLKSANVVHQMHVILLGESEVEKVAGLFHLDRDVVSYICINLPLLTSETEET